MGRLLRIGKVAVLLIIAFVLASSFGQQAILYAISSNDLDSIYNNTPFYDPNAAVCRNSNGTTVLNGSGSAQQAFNYFVGQGLDPITTAAIVGNFMEESYGVNPTIVQQYQNHPTAYSNTIPFYAFGNAGYGIAQWTSSGRQQGLVKAASTAGLPNSGTQPWQQEVGDLGVQLDFSWSELTGSYSKVLDQAKADAVVPSGATMSEIYAAIDKATVVIMNGYESPNASLAAVHARKSAAESAYSNYAADASGSTCASTNFTTGFIFYKQCDNYSDYSSTEAERIAAQAWSSSLYGKAAAYKFNTVCNQGCGPTAMAMIITNLTEQAVTPYDTATYGQQHGTADPGGDGSIGNLLGPVIGGHWGLKSTPIPNFSIDQINQTLRSGGLVLAGGHEDSEYDQTKANPPGPFSVGGHFIVIRAITSDGKWLVGNPGGWPDNAEYDPLWVLAHTTVHNAWALTKG